MYKGSLPSRERGLKFYDKICTGWLIWSLPSRERGLKWQRRGKKLQMRFVAPFAGAWIEIIGSEVEVNLEDVAPFAGARIEIKDAQIGSRQERSLPSRERGLKFERTR